MGRPIRVGVAERRKERETGFRRDGPRDNFRRDRDRDREGGDDEGKTWRSQRGKGPVADPLHADRTTVEPAAAPVSPPPAKSNKPDPFGGARPVDSREAEKKLLELQKQKEEEERKKREEEKKKREDEAIKKRKKPPKSKLLLVSQQVGELTKQPMEREGGTAKEGGMKTLKAAGGLLIKETQKSQPAAVLKEGNLIPLDEVTEKPLFLLRPRTIHPRANLLKQVKRQSSQPKRNAVREAKKAERPPREAKAPRSSEPPAKIANNNAFALLGEDEEA